MATIGPGIVSAISNVFTNRASSIRFKVPGIPGPEVVFTLDATTILQTNMKAKATQFPVDGGKNISDHVQPDPLTLSVKGIISESPNNFLLTLATSISQGLLTTAGLTGSSATFATAALSAGVSAAAALGGASGTGLDPTYAYLLSDVNRGITSSEYPKTAMKGMESMFRQGVPFTFRTYFSDDLYQNMVMTSLSFTQESKTGDSLMFDMTCQKVEVVKSILGLAKESAAAQPAASSAPKSKAGGPKPTKSVKAKVPAKRGSFLHSQTTAV